MHYSSVQSDCSIKLSFGENVIDSGLRVTTLERIQDRHGVPDRRVTGSSPIRRLEDDKEQSYRTGRGIRKNMFLVSLEEEVEPLSDLINKKHIKSNYSLKTSLFLKKLKILYELFLYLKLKYFEFCITN